MKKIIALCSALVLTLSLGSCVKKPPEPTPTPTAVPTPTPTATVAPTPTPTAEPTPSGPPAWTEDEAYAAFQAASETAGVTGWTPAGCAVVDDNFADLGAVILYTDENRNTSCNLAYLHQEGGTSIFTFFSNTSEDKRDYDPISAPAYLGEGKVSVDVKENATGKTYRATITASSEGWEDFTVDSQPLS